MRSLRAIALVAAVVLALAGCGDDGGDASDDVSADAGLPPTTPAELAPMYEDVLAEHGMVLTDRGGLIDLSDGGYEVSDDGTHLALYLEPVEERSVDAYVDGLVELTAVFAADVFDRWPGLESFDVCQEPAPAGPDEPSRGIAITQVDLTREASGSIDWETAELTDLIAAVLTDEGSSMRVGPPVSSDDSYTAALAAAHERTGIEQPSGW